MYVITEQKQADEWQARVRLETNGGWRCFQAAGDSRVGALMKLHHAMWRYEGNAYDVARRAVVSAACRSTLSPRALRATTRPRSRGRVATTKAPGLLRRVRRYDRPTAWA